MIKIAGHVSHAFFGLWFLIVFSVCAFFCLLAALLVPGLARRQAIVSALTQVIFKLTGTGPDIDGLSLLPDGPCVIVANHASYLDGIVMTAVLPPRFSFLIKAEMNNIPLAGFVLRRIDSFFVDRSHSAKSATSARQIIRAAKAGRALGVFPEGTFTDEPGLRRFQKGAFAVARAGRMPIVPVVIEGTRHILPASSWWPRYGRITVTLLPAIDAEQVKSTDMEALRDNVRETIAEQLAEPDLLQSDDHASID
ncbi:MAG: lysophospholipid acyltransferase family protein [Woeseiaceae bacterium]